MSEMFRYRSRMPASAETVYQVHAEPDALKQLTPPWEKAQVVSRTGSIEKPGSRVTLRVAVGPFLRDWVAEHAACQPGRMFRDVMISGPFRRWEHIHEFLPESDTSSWLQDTVEYEFPLGWFGKLFGGRYTRKRLQLMFEWRHKATAQILQERAKKPGN